MSFRVDDFRDLDLMLKLASLGAAGVTAKDLAGELGANSDKGGSVIAARLTWMATFGMLRRDPKTSLWTISPGGERVIESKVRAATWPKMEQVPDEALIDVMAHITNRYQHGDSIIGHMLRREFQYGTSPLRRS